MAEIVVIVVPKRRDEFDQELVLPARMRGKKKAETGCQNRTEIGGTTTQEQQLGARTLEGALKKTGRSVRKQDGVCAVFVLGRTLVLRARV